MKKIFLFCSYGMSTSLLASSMQNCANDHLLPIEVVAYPHGQLRKIMETNRPDVIMLGPQVKYLLEETKERYGSFDIPILLIDQNDYGMLNGEAVLKQAVKAMKLRKKAKVQEANTQQEEVQINSEVKKNDIS